jgi:hypothetical protein
VEILNTAARELTDIAAHELPEHHQMKLNPAVNGKVILSGGRLSTAAKRETRVTA